ncbi:MAG TPA: LacI family DNA-binding transcriptional regulator [Solirubrobacterales bacterium]|nr:LacI family DNA-binding transcriptional regulator [Solirubrobacterales bacterium]
MRHVAALAGVSLKTVSRVVNGEPTVDPALAERVRAAIEELGYEPDPIAQSLRRRDGRTRTIAAIVDDLANPFSAALHHAAVESARTRGVLVLAANSGDDPEQARQAFGAFARRHVDGVILMPSSAREDWLVPELAKGMNVVTVDRPIEGIDGVVSDNRAAATRATEHLLRRGHGRIGYLGDLRNLYTAQERVAGYRSAMESLEGDLDESLVRQDIRGREQAEKAAIEMLIGPDPPTALFSGQNLITLGAVRALHKLRLEQSVALVGFDDIEFGDLIEPGITVLAQDPSELGRLATEQLLARIEGETSPPRIQVVPARLIPRGSGEIGLVESGR